MKNVKVDAGEKHSTDPLIGRGFVARGVGHWAKV